VRASPWPTVRRLDFVPFPGVAVSVDAPPEGATYLIDKRGRVRRWERACDAPRGPF